MKSTLLLTVAALLLPLLALAEEEPDVAAVVKEFKAAMKSREAAERIEAVRAVEKTRHEDVAAALSKCLGDRDPKVRGAVARALGAQGDRKHVKALLGRLGQWEKDDPDSVTGVLDGLAALADESAVDGVAGVVRKILTVPRTDAVRTGVSAVGVLAKVPAKATVDELTGLLDLTMPTGSAKGYVSEEDRILRTSIRDAIFVGLTGLTGRRIKVAEVWQSWWKKAAKGFEFPVAPSDPNAGSTFTADGYGFTIEKPAPSWTFSCPDTVFVVVKLEHRAAAGSRRTDAEVQIEAYSTSEYSVQNAAQASADMDMWARNTGFKKGPDGRPMIREAPTSAPARMAGQEGVLWRAAGTDVNGKEVILRMFFFIRGTLLYTVTMETVPSLPDDLAADVEKAVASLRFGD